MKLSKEYPYLTVEEVRYTTESSKYKTERGLKIHLQKLNDKNKQKVEMPDVKRLEIELEWTRSNTWGLCPRASAVWETTDGKWHHEENISYASGCGYDKASTVVAKCCNEILCGMLWRKRNTRKKAPYGISMNNWFPSFSGGVGMSCYRNIADFLGGKMEHVANSKYYDKYVFTF